MNPGDSRVTPLPRGIEVLLKKASVDPEFRKVLLDSRAAAAKGIGLELGTVEAALLDAVPAGQLEAVIERTEVSPMSRAAFLGSVAATMLAALGPSRTADACVLGITVDRHVVYEETGYNGVVTHGVLRDRELRARQTTIAHINKFLAEAHAQASRAWAENPPQKGVSFPMPAPQPIQLKILKAFHKAQEAQDALAEVRRQRAAEVREREAARLAKMSKEERKQASEQAALLRAAEKLFHEKLQAILSTAPGPDEGGPLGIHK
ncbi:MAG: hypothetical protein FJ290_12715 [Planctomycetes bacterium]|nr:hypothetical protein [Planctomycetota bacterium]